MFLTDTNHLRLLWSFVHVPDFLNVRMNDGSKKMFELFCARFIKTVKKLNAQFCN